MHGELAALERQLVESGERDRLVELLRRRLTESGWHSKIRQRCKEVIREKGVEQVTVEELIAAVTPDARRSVADGIKKEMFEQIKVFLADKSGINDL